MYIRVVLKYITKIKQKIIMGTELNVLFLG